MESFNISSGIKIVDNLIIVIQENKQYLSDIDGAIGDGDHGINMNKGFTMTRDALDKNPGDLIHGLNILSKILMMRIGGSMGPLYGKFFKSIATSFEGKEKIEKKDFGQAMEAIISDLSKISSAKVGDKTLLDTLVPATKAFSNALIEMKSFPKALGEMKVAAIDGRDSTKDMVAKLGRASRLGERSRGVLDAGAVSCSLILCSMADTITELIDN